MITFGACFLTILVITNLVLWYLCRFGLIESLKIKQQQLDNACTVNRNLMTYIDELQHRCEQYRASKVTEILAGKITTSPAERVYPINPNSIITNLN